MNNNSCYSIWIDESESDSDSSSVMIESADERLSYNVLDSWNENSLSLICESPSMNLANLNDN